MITLIDLHAGYGTTEVLHGISACLERGMLTSIIGPNGCGKSTLLKTVSGILRHSGGKILLDGVPADTLNRESLALRIAYLAQERHVPEMTVGQMVLHGRFPHLHFPRRYSAQDRKIADAAMEKLGIQSYADMAVASLSGGMRQSAYLAMALAQETEYILLDEPTTYLDIGNQLSLMRLLRCLSQEGKGIAAVMHDLPLALTYSDRVLVMREGRAVMLGTPKEIVSSGIPEELFGAAIAYENGQYFYRLKTT